MSLLDTLKRLFGKDVHEDHDNHDCYVIETVEEGDTLSGISQKLGRAPEQWTELYAVNQDTIKDPNKIYPGQRIRIPKRWDT